MKNSFYLIAFVLVFFTSCNKSVEKSIEISVDESAKEVPLLKGVWELVSYYNYDENGVSDTIKSTKGNRQIKIYTDTKVNWSRYRESDSLDWFGYGNYSNTDSSLTENLEYGSKSMNQIISEREAFEFNLVLENDKFSQIEIDEEGNILFAENYIRIE